MTCGGQHCRIGYVRQSATRRPYHLKQSLLEPKTIRARGGRSFEAYSVCLTALSQLALVTSCKMHAISRFVIKI
jgi:hypothetical protein